MVCTMSLNSCSLSFPTILVLYEVVAIMIGGKYIQYEYSAGELLVYVHVWVWVLEVDACV